MKKYIYKLVIVVLLTTFYTSCSVDDFEQEGKLTEDSLFKDESLAKVALNGIYVASRPDQMGIDALTRALATAGVEQKPGLAVNPRERAFFTNTVEPAQLGSTGGVLFTFYLKSYRLINLANLFVKKVEQGVPGVSKATTNQMSAEAKTLRANAYFNLLRVFGQFYNVNSEYGVITSADVIDGQSQLKRATVQQTYDLIISDLEFAVQNAADAKPHYFVNKSFAESLLSKVYLAKGDYAKAVTHSENVINSLGANFDLEAAYKDIFSQGFNSKEVLYAPYQKESTEEIISTFTPDYINPTETLETLGDEMNGGSNGEIDPRYTFTFVIENSGNPDPNPDPTEEVGTKAYNKYPTKASPYYYLRVAEVYLIHAEAVVRSNGDNQKALAALNKIRERAGVPARTFTDKATFLEDVRKEKMIELSIENAQPWFDFVRYDRLGDISAKALKPTIVNENKLIFPIALSTLFNNPNFGPQNPGY